MLCTPSTDLTRTTCDVAIVILHDVAGCISNIVDIANFWIRKGVLDAGFESLRGWNDVVKLACCGALSLRCPEFLHTSMVPRFPIGKARLDVSCWVGSILGVIEIGQGCIGRMAVFPPVAPAKSRRAWQDEIRSGVRTMVRPPLYGTSVS